MLAFALMLVLADPASAPPPPADAAAAESPPATMTVEDGCGLVVQGADGKKSVVPPSPEVHVMGVGGPLHIAAPAGQTLVGVMCHRSSVVPDAEDDRVLRDLHVPLYIAGNGVTAKLTQEGAAYTLRALDGAWPATDQPQIDAVLALFKSRLSAGG